MQLEYIIADPTGNITALVLTPVPPEEQPRAAAALMAREKSVEQTGFLRLTERGAELRMAGGEVCGNATLSAAAVFARERGLAPGETTALPVRVSGAPGPVGVSVTALADGGYSGTVEMPLPAAAGLKPLRLDGRELVLPCVEFPGITHIIAPGDMDAGEAERAAREWCASLGASALGLMLLDEAARRLRPLVYVPAGDTLFWESSCASGTAAVGAWICARDGGECRLTLEEPGGRLRVEAAPGTLRLGGQVRLGERKMSEAWEN